MPGGYRYFLGVSSATEGYPARGFCITLRRVLRVHASALKHGCTREDVSHAYDMALFEGVVDEGGDPPKLLIVGPDGAGNLLELIGGELEEDLWIWHAMPCRLKYVDLLPGTGGDK